MIQFLFMSHHRDWGQWILIVTLHTRDLNIVEFGFIGDCHWICSGIAGHSLDAGFDIVGSHVFVLGIRGEQFRIIRINFGEVWGRLDGWPVYHREWLGIEKA